MVSERASEGYKVRTPTALKALLKRQGYSNEAIEEIWKWYDFSERSGVNF